MDYLISKEEVIHVIATDYHVYCVWRVEMDREMTDQCVAIERDGRWLHETNKKIRNFSVELSGGVNFDNHVSHCLRELRDLIRLRNETIKTDGRVCDERDSS